MKRNSVFISHSSRCDNRSHTQEFVRSLAYDLRLIAIDVFHDDDTLADGENLMRAIEQGILQARIGVIVLTQLSQKSSWVEFEVAEMARERACGKLKILVIALESGLRVPGGIVPDQLIEAKDQGRLKLVQQTIRVIQDMLAAL